MLLGGNRTTENCYKRERLSPEGILEEGWDCPRKRGLGGTESCSCKDFYFCKGSLSVSFVFFRCK
jgi:hypothetical protein